MITCKKLMTNKLLIGSALGAMLSAAIITGCAVDNRIEAGGDSDHTTVSREISERGGSESAGGHNGVRESNEFRRGNEARGELGGSSEGGGEYGSRESGGESSGEVDSISNGEGNEVGGGESGSESGGESAGEHGGRGEEVGSEGGNENSGGEINEAAMSSPVIPLDQSWNGTLGGLAVSMRYDKATKSVYGTARNSTSQQLCYVQAEPHLKSGTQTVGELGPEKLGDLNPGQTANTNLSVASEPSLAEMFYDGYVVHMEVYDCAGSGPVPHTGGEGSESGDGESGIEHGSGGEEGSGTNTLSLDETFEEVRGGARLILNYDAPSNSFKGTVENTTNGVLNRVRIEVHLSNGTELGPTTPIDMPPGAVAVVNMPATQASFTGWIAHAEVGGGESGGEHGSGNKSGGEHGGKESGGEHGSSRESGGEHGGRGERRGGG